MQNSEYKFRAALFDFDGTLALTEEEYTVFWNDLAARYRPDLQNFALMIKGTPTADTINNYFPETDRPEIRRRLEYFESHMPIMLTTGTIDFLRDLKTHGVKIAVVTSSNTTKMGYAMAQVPELAELVDRMLTTEDFSAPKPEPDCYQKGAEVFGLKQEECVVFEDAPAGLKAGMSSGSMTIGLATERPMEDIAAESHHGIFDFSDLTFERVEEWLKKHNTD